MKTWVPRVALASIVIVAVQTTVVSPYRIAGIAIMLVWLWPLCAGLLGDQRSGVVAGLLSGLLFDAHVATPFGLFAVVGALAWREDILVSMCLLLAGLLTMLIYSVPRLKRSPAAR